jgi:hypothetical protein
MVVMLLLPETRGRSLADLDGATPGSPALGPKSAALSGDSN